MGEQLLADETMVSKPSVEAMGLITGSLVEVVQSDAGFGEDIPDRHQTTRTPVDPRHPDKTSADLFRVE